MNTREPLAYRMRPQNFDEFVGQDHIVGKDKPLRQLVEKDEIRSIILWGPAGTGKTTLANLISKATRANFISLSAVTAGVENLRTAIASGKDFWRGFSQKTILFIDEIHRFNKAQQDYLLPHVESGDIALIGATTENPYFEVIAPLVSRSIVFHLDPLKNEDISEIINRSLKDKERGVGSYKLSFSDDAIELVLNIASGDARAALNIVEWALLSGQKKITAEIISEIASKKLIKYDKKGDEHYDTISAFIKSMRGSDPDATLYWLVKMIEAGEDPKFIARRIVIAASEDVGNADPQALMVSNAAFETVNKVGLPEAEYALAQAAVYVACAPKSNAIKNGLAAAKEALASSTRPTVPKHLRNPVKKGLVAEGYGEGYKYPHDFPGNFTPQQYRPTELEGKVFYDPSDQGYEQVLKERLNFWRKQIATEVGPPEGGPTS